MCRSGFWRGVNTNQNAIYMECFIDEVAHAAGKDPLEFRRAMLAKSPKHLAVLNAVAEKAEWDEPLPAGRVPRDLPELRLWQLHGRGRRSVGLAQGRVEGASHRRGDRSGYAVNPQQIEAQVQGSFVYGLSAVLFGEITIDKGRAVETNFDTYPVMRIADMPKVETIIAPSGGFWGGVGEPTIAVAGPAVLNAIFAATGKRIRTLPLRQHDLAHA